MPIETVTCLNHVVCDNCGKKISSRELVGASDDLEYYCFPDIEDLEHCLNSVDWTVTDRPVDYAAYRKGREDKDYHAIFGNFRYYCPDCSQAAADADKQRMEAFAAKYEEEH